MMVRSTIVTFLSFQVSMAMDPYSKGELLLKCTNEIKSTDEASFYGWLKRATERLDEVLEEKRPNETDYALEPPDNVSLSPSRTSQPLPRGIRPRSYDSFLTWSPRARLRSSTLIYSQSF